jgi:serpin B
MGWKWKHATARTTSRPSAPATPPLVTLVTATNDFGFHLYAKLARQDGQKNLLISPVSLEYALTMVANGARGETYREIANTLGWGTLPVAQVGVGFQSLTDRLLANDRQVQISLTNALWLDAASTALQDDFLQANKQYFSAEMHTVNFKDPATTSAMNDWGKTQTQGMVSAVMGPDNTAQLVMMSALHYQGAWMVPFQPQHTSAQPFTLDDGTRLTVKMMQLEDKCIYYEDAQLQMVQLPYDQGEMSLLIILPRTGTSLADIARRVFSDANWPNYLANLTPRAGTLRLPRFRAEYACATNEALQALGMTAPFDPHLADFSAISKSPSPLALGNVTQTTALAVDEAGAKASAASVTPAITTVSYPSDPPFTMTVDHPFLVAIAQKDRALLFLGSIMKPE